MKNFIIKLATIAIILSTNTVCKEKLSAITYKLSRGRFGDCLQTYFKAKWLSYKNNIPLLYVPFKYSNQLLMHNTEQKYSINSKKNFNKVIKKNDFQIKRKEGNLYIVNFYTNTKIDWKDNNFKNELKRNVYPIAPITKPDIPQGYISIAVHVRKGGGYDAPLISKGGKTPKKGRKAADKRWPKKFPPDSYYMDQIKNLYEKLDKKPLYIRIFTDDKNPSRIVKKYKTALNKKNVIFSCREKNNRHNKNVLEDFFCMMHYDCLIRPLSSFSLTSERIGNFFIVISPKSFHWKGNKLIIDKVNFTVNKNNFYKIEDLLDKPF